MTDVPRPRRPPRDRTTVVLILAGTFGLQALTLVTGIIIARVLGVEGRGLVALVFALGLFASQLTFGGSPAIAVAKNLAARQVTARDGLRAIARRRAAWLPVPCLAVGLLFIAMQASQPRTETLVYAGAVVLMALQTIAFRLLIAGLQGEGQVVRMAWCALIPQLLFAIALSTAWAAGWGWDAMAMLAAYFLSCFLGLAGAFLALRAPTGRSEDGLDEAELWAESKRSYISSVRPLDSLGLDRILVGGVAGTLALGLYATATAVSNLCTLVGNAITTIVLPRVAMHHADPQAQGAVIRRWVTVSTVLVVAMVLALQAVVEPVIRIAFGEAFVGAVPCARWLIVADGFMSIRKVLIAALQGQGRGGVASWIELALLPVMLAGIVVAAALGSLVGVGVALVGVGILACAALAWAVTRPLR